MADDKKKETQDDSFQGSLMESKWFWVANGIMVLGFVAALLFAFYLANSGTR